MSLLPKSIALTTESLAHFLPQLPGKLDLRRFFRPVSEKLVEVEDRLRAEAREFDSSIVPYAEYACESKGKRIRPALALLTAHATGGVRQTHIDLAVVVELIHLATLVHDDIMDGATKRRGQPTAFSKWGVDVSVLLGDCLFCRALMLCANFPTTAISRSIAHATNEVCSGEILQTQRRFDLKLDIPEYLRIIEMKTAALFRVSTELAALLNDRPEAEVKACQRYGDLLGVAYQIYDDCLDLVGTESGAGKTIGTDLIRGKLTLPLLHLLSQVKGREHEEICEVILHGSPEDRMGLLKLVVDRGGLKAAVMKIKETLDEAAAALEILPDTEYRTALQGIPRELFSHVGRIG